MLDPVIGREEEIRRLIQILSRRSKNNVRSLLYWSKVEGRPLPGMRLPRSSL